MKDFFSAVKERRSYYGISGRSPISDDRIKEIVNFAVKQAPSAFNCQSGRVILLLNKHHGEFWQIVKEALRKIVPPEKFGPTDKKIDSFAAGYGTVLFFEDERPIKDLQSRFPTYATEFPSWSDHSSGMIQFVVWAGLEAEGLGASLQHYGPVIEEVARKKWDIPAEWRFISQMPFGAPVGEPGEKDFLPLEDRVRVFERQ
jgi:predicted oxidoreductase (fatty acid repression mutant protein)